MEVVACFMAGMDAGGPAGWKPIYYFRNNRVPAGIIVTD